MCVCVCVKPSHVDNHPTNTGSALRQDRSKALGKWHNPLVMMIPFPLARWWRSLQKLPKAPVCPCIVYFSFPLSFTWGVRRRICIIRLFYFLVFHPLPWLYCASGFNSVQKNKHSLTLRKACCFKRSYLLRRVFLCGCVRLLLAREWKFVCEQVSPVEILHSYGKMKPRFKNKAFPSQNLNTLKCYAKLNECRDTEPLVL